MSSWGICCLASPRCYFGFTVLGSVYFVFSMRLIDFMCTDIA